MIPKDRPDLECPLVYPEIEIDNVNEIEEMDIDRMTAIRDLRPRVLSYYMKQNHKTLLDVSCGNGRNLKYYKWKGFEVVGTEFVDQLITQNLSQGFECYRVDLNTEKLPFEDSIFDVVTCTDVLEHLEYPKIVIQELIRVCKEMVLITIPAGYSYFAPEHLHFFDEKSLKILLSEIKNYTVGVYMSKPEDFVRGERFYLIVIEKGRG